MRAKGEVEASRTHTPIFAPAAQRAQRCACGRNAGLDSICPECRARRIAGQARLDVSRSGDALEREADRAAAAVVEKSARRIGPLTRGATRAVQRQVPPPGPKPPEQFPAQQTLTPEHELWRKAIEEIVKRVTKDMVLPVLAATPEGRKIVAFLQSPLGKAFAGGVLGGVTGTVLGINAAVQAAAEEPRARKPSGEQSFGVLGTTHPAEMKGVRVFGVDVAPPEKPKQARPQPPDPSAKTYPWPPKPAVDPAEQEQTLRIWLTWNLQHRDDIVQSALQAAAGLGKPIDPMTAFQIWLDLLAKRPTEETSTPIAPSGPLPATPLQYQFKRDGAAISVVEPEAVEAGLRSPGAPLDKETRHLMESRFEHDFGAVRVHTDATAASAAAAAGALAYTSGTDIVFGAGQYSPGSAAGRALLAHELAHTIQQQRQDDPLGVQTPAVSNHAAEHEAERAAVAAAAGRPPSLTPTPLRLALQTSGDLKAIRRWKYVAYEKEVKLIYFEPPPKIEDPYAEEPAKKPRAIKVGTIPWVTNNPGNIDVDPKAEAQRRAVSIAAAATLPPPATLVGGALPEAFETLQTIPYRLGATGVYEGRRGVFPTATQGLAAILPFLRSIGRFARNPNITVTGALGVYKGQEGTEGPEVKAKYVRGVRGFMIGAGLSIADTDALLATKVSEIESAPNAAKLVAALTRQEGALEPPGVVFNCDGFVENTRGLYDARQWGLIQALKGSPAAKDELRGLLGCN